MVGRFSYFASGAALMLVLTAAAAMGACGSSGESTSAAGGGSVSSAGGNGPGGGGSTGSLITGTGGMSQAFDVKPAALQTITVVAGQMMPTVMYSATENGAPVSVNWATDNAALGTMMPASGATSTFAPRGTAGGMVTVLAKLGATTVTRQVFIKLTVPPQNGANPNDPLEQTQIAMSVPQLAQGGGIGGVGGEGLGPAFPNFPAMVNPPAQGLAFLYPYDKTVWPRGMLAPLLMWTWGPGDADAIQIDLKTTSGSFSWTGTFGRPAILMQTGGPFIRHPIPQDVWDMATDTAGGATPNGMPDQLVVGLTVAKGGQAYGPITETWPVAPGRLAGTVYYNSYGTQLVQNSIEPSFNNGPQFGAAVLAIKSGVTAPTVVAGTPSPLYTGSGCRVCHVVAMDGSHLIAQHGDDYSRTSSYDLKNGNMETSLDAYDGTYGWAGLFPDSSMAFTNTADLAANAPSSQLYTFPPVSTMPLAVSGIPADLQAGTPTFSPDGKHVAFDFLGGNIGGKSGNGTELVTMAYDPAKKAFSALQVLATMPAGDPNRRAGFPSFFPTDDAVVFHQQIVASNHRYNTWHGAKAQIWWSDLPTGTAVSLDALNGLDAGGKTSYLPTGPAKHGQDELLNYEPTMSPVVTGGYAWVIFTSRRLYGSVATTDPWQSDPRDYDATQVANATCKKLWVAAVDIGSIQNGKFVEGVPPGTDPSHPAFYLPAQELLAGNARGFWVLEPCRQDGMGCLTGDQCCNGFCEQNGGAYTCTSLSGGCSGNQEKCTTAADCCDPTALCINGFCASNIH